MTHAQRATLARAPCCNSADNTVAASVTAAYVRLGARSFFQAGCLQSGHWLRTMPGPSSVATTHSLCAETGAITHAGSARKDTYTCRCGVEIVGSMRAGEGYGDAQGADVHSVIWAVRPHWASRQAPQWPMLYRGMQYDRQIARRTHRQNVWLHVGVLNVCGLHIVLSLRRGRVAACIGALREWVGWGDMEQAGAALVCVWATAELLHHRTTSCKTIVE